MSGNCAIVELETAAALAPSPASREELSEELLRARFAVLARLNDEEDSEDDDDDDDDWEDEDDLDDLDDLDDDDDDDLDEEEEPVDEP